MRRAWYSVPALCRFHLLAHANALLLLPPLGNAQALCLQFLGGVIGARLLYNIGHLRIEITTRTSGGIEITVSLNGTLPDRIELIYGTKRCDEMCRSCFLCFCGDSGLKVSDEINTDCMAILSIDMRSNCTKRPSLLDRTILANQKMIADARPTVVQMPLMNGFRRNMPIW